MRFPVDRRRPFARGLIVFALAGTVSACGTLGGGGPAGSVAALPANGPQADYPVLVGEPYAIDGVAFTPADTLNYDEVGYLAAERGTEGITGAHHTLPVPSYAEVTSLETGRTILVRLERRGPMDSTHLVALSPGALAQLQSGAGTPVRVRRVNPPEAQRMPLRAGEVAPLRMDTPMSLVAVLRRKLGEPPIAADMQTADLAETARPPQVAPHDVPSSDEPEVAGGPSALPPLAPVGDAIPAEASFEVAFAPEVTEAVPEQKMPEPAPEPRNEPDGGLVDGGFMVQAAAFSTEDRARSAAAALGGRVLPAGRFFRVRTGPFASREEAEASLAIVQAAGYSDARILTSG